MTDSPQTGSLKLTPFVFPELTQPNGALDPAEGCQACWYFYTCAEQVRQKAGTSIDSQIIVVDSGQDNSVPWMNKNYESIAASVSLLYGLESPDEFQRYWPLVMIQAVEMGYPPPHPEYTGRVRLKNISV